MWDLSVYWLQHLLFACEEVTLYSRGHIRELEDLHILVLMIKSFSFDFKVGSVVQIKFSWPIVYVKLKVFKRTAFIFAKVFNGIWGLNFSRDYDSLVYPENLGGHHFFGALNILVGNIFALIKKVMITLDHEPVWQDRLFVLNTLVKYFLSLEVKIRYRLGLNGDDCLAEDIKHRLVLLLLHLVLPEEH